MENAGRLGEVFDNEDLSMPKKRSHFQIVELDQVSNLA